MSYRWLYIHRRYTTPHCAAAVVYCILLYNINTYIYYANVVFIHTHIYKLYVRIAVVSFGDGFNIIRRPQQYAYIYRVVPFAEEYARRVPLQSGGGKSVVGNR